MNGRIKDKSYWKMSLEEKIEHDMVFIREHDEDISMELEEPNGVMNNYNIGWIYKKYNDVDFDDYDNNMEHIAVDYETSVKKIKEALIKVIKRHLNVKDITILE
jgi:hypothetical protein